MLARPACRPLTHVVVAGALGLACATGPGASQPAAAAPVVARRLTSTQELSTACVTTGPELCFNATDDNCNGVIDEGCGVATGVLQFMIAWGDSVADVDLVVFDASGARVAKGKRAGGLSLEKNCPADDCRGQNIENVFFDGAEPPPGRYAIEVRLVEPHGAELPVKVRFSARVGARVYFASLALARAQDKESFAFEL